MSVQIPEEHQFKAKWRWPEEIEATVRELATGYSLNICAGKSPLGDVRVDADPDNDPDVVADMKSLPFPDGHFDSVIFDPPWKVAYFDRFKPFYEAVRVTKLGGRIIVNAKWPCESDRTEIINPWTTEGDDEFLIVRTDNPWRDASIITVHEKVADQTALDSFMIDAETDAAPARPRPNTWDYCGYCGEHRPKKELPVTAPWAMHPFCSEECRDNLEWELPERPL